MHRTALHCESLHETAFLGFGAIGPIRLQRRAPRFVHRQRRIQRRFVEVVFSLMQLGLDGIVSSGSVRKLRTLYCYWIGPPAWSVGNETETSMGFRWENSKGKEYTCFSCGKTMAPWLHGPSDPFQAMPDDINGVETLLFIWCSPELPCRYCQSE